ncbi:MAG: DUF2911 domain-containing protein [Verrucomicrobiota bacterium JB022]|nr:DUF2911 domain-containing protein [Verrucomicrobiota bacterium JB022]
MTKPLYFFALAALALPLNVSAQQQPPKSPAAEIEQMVGFTEIDVSYARPSARDRDIYGALVPYGEVWRAGANASTKVSFSRPVKVGDVKLAAGVYSLFAIPGKDEWTIIFNKDTAAWGAYRYDESMDVARVTAEPVKIEPFVETFTIGFDGLKDDSAMMYLDWANTRVAFPIVVAWDEKK